MAHAYFAPVRDEEQHLLAQAKAQQHAALMGQQHQQSHEAATAQAQANAAANAQNAAAAAAAAATATDGTPAPP